MKETEGQIREMTTLEELWEIITQFPGQSLFGITIHYLAFAKWREAILLDRFNQFP
jgi:hypothetical protein